MDCEVVNKLRYYKVVDTSGKLISIGTGTGGTEITAEEYAALSDEIAQKAALVAALAAGEISAEDVPENWREEIVRRAGDTGQDTAVYTETTLQAMTNAELETILAGFGISASMNKANMVRLILAAQGGDGID